MHRAMAQELTHSKLTDRLAAAERERRLRSAALGTRSGAVAEGGRVRRTIIRLGQGIRGSATAR